LGVLNSLMGEPAVAINGFCISSGPDEACIRLPYDASPSHHAPGFSLDHGLIRQRLMQAARTLPRVTVVDDARVVGVDQNEREVIVQVAEHRVITQYRSRLLVAADGASSPIRRLAGIGVQKRRISTLFGYRIPGAHLPQRDYGFVFLGGRTPVLAYPVDGNGVRIMFDIPYDASRRPDLADCPALTAMLPPDLRRAVDHCIATQGGPSAVIQEVIANRLASGRVVLIGDAAVTCHPLTATGMTMCITDALLLRDAIAERPGDLRQALHLHQRHRRWRQVTRISLAEALRDVFCGERSEMRPVQRGIIRYWRTSSTGRTASMALLSTADGRLTALIHQFVRVVLHGLLAETRDPTGTARPGPREAYCLARDLSSVLARQLWRVIGRCRTIWTWSTSGT
jgi:2-polyprenyl-6-methoxyphenol hydroxylase-like FAD-dependent oxidoreductase